MDKKRIYIKEIGEVLLKKSNRRKNFGISIKAFEGVCVTFPAAYDFKAAETVALNKKDWILKQLPKIKELENNYTLFDEKTTFKTKKHSLRIVKQHGSKLSIEIKNNLIHVFYPDYLSIQEKSIQEFIRKGIEEALRVEAREYLPERVEKLSRKYGFAYKQLYIKNTKSCWGSCSGVNNINLSLYLMRLPYHLIDYVILHELCHTLEKNHSKNFWRLLDKTTAGKAKKFDKELGNYSTKIF